MDVVRVEDLDAIGSERAGGPDTRGGRDCRGGGNAARRDDERRDEKGETLS
jgi:hypothetical protein